MTEKKDKKFMLILKLLKRNLQSLHHLVWGKGWKRFSIAVIITLVAITAFMILTLEVTSHPRFCNTCQLAEIDAQGCDLYGLPFPTRI